MYNKLSELLKTDTVKRCTQDYEDTFDDFITFAGGLRVVDVATIPQGVDNADYVLETDDARLIIELKQITKYDKALSVDQYFSALLRRGKVRSPTFTGLQQLQIEPHSLSHSDWRDFYQKFRPRIAKDLDKAAKQIKATRSFLSAAEFRQIGVAILVNTGDFNLPVDLMFRIVERHAKAKWKRGLFSALDCILCLSMDMIKSGQHPLHGRGIVRAKEDEVVSQSALYLYDRWIHYGAAAVGAKVSFMPGYVEPDPFQLDGGMAGKIHWAP